MYGSCLTDGEFQVEQRQPGECQHEGVGEEEGAAAVAVAQIGETPNVAQAHGVAEARKEKVALEKMVNS